MAFYVKKSKYEKKIVKIVMMLFILVRISGELAVWIGIVVVLVYPKLYNNIDPQSSILYYALCKTAPDFCIIIRLFVSLLTLMKSHYIVVKSSILSGILTILMPIAPSS